MGLLDPSSESPSAVVMVRSGLGDRCTPSPYVRSGNGVDGGGVKHAEICKSIRWLRARNHWACMHEITMPVQVRACKVAISSACLILARNPHHLQRSSPENKVEVLG